MWEKFVSVFFNFSMFRGNFSRPHMEFDKCDSWEQRIPVLGFWGGGKSLFLWLLSWGMEQAGQTLSHYNSSAKSQERERWTSKNISVFALLIPPPCKKCEVAKKYVWHFSDIHLRPQNMMFLYSNPKDHICTDRPLNFVLRALQRFLATLVALD